MLLFRYKTHIRVFALALICNTALLFESCRSIYYEAATPNIPIFEDNEILKTSFEWGNHGIDSKVNLRLFKYGVLQAQANYADWSFFINGANYLYSTGVGGLYQTPQMHISLVAGYGRGWSFFMEGLTHDMHKGKASYHQFYIQPCFAMVKPNLTYGIAIKTAYMPYRIYQNLSGINLEWRGIVMNHDYKCLSVEPVAFFSMELTRYMQFNFYIGKNLFFSEIPYYSNLPKSEMYFGSGITISVYDRKHNQ